MLTDGQQQALAELREIEEADPDGLEVLGHWEGGRAGALTVEVSLDCRGLRHAAGGIRVRERERLQITVPKAFPFTAPSVWTTHDRWAGTPHVNWRRYLCLYVASATEWNPDDSMFGFVDRLILWLTRAAAGELDPVGAPLHPPHVVPTAGMPTVIPRANTPTIENEAWVGFADLNLINKNRVEIVGWRHLDDDLQSGSQAAALLLPSAFPIEYPDYARQVTVELTQQGIPAERLLALLRIAALLQDDGTDLYVIIGTPMRGVRGERPVHHLATWRIASTWADGLRVAVPRESDSEQLRTLRANIADLVEGWLDTAPVHWCPVREARPEATQPRDAGSPTCWWAGKVVHLWGCGALGTHVAEHLVRAGVQRLVLVDNKVVTPGLLVRQRFDDADIGVGKPKALASRLRQIRPDLDVEARFADVTTSEQVRDNWYEDANVVIDTTASNSVRALLEQLRKDKPSQTSIVSILVGHQAANGLVVTCPPGTVAGPLDCTRQAKLAASRKPRLTSFADEFWPESPRTDWFQPEPGCSDPTFTGSDADVAALAATMLVAASDQFASNQRLATATFVDLPRTNAGRTETVEFTDDYAIEDGLGGYQVRIDRSALAELHAWIAKSERRNPGDETGGILFGQRSDVARVVWVTDVLGPPPDSQRAPHGFVCGRAGVDEAAARIKRRSRGASVVVGMWHTHPDGRAIPSSTDVDGMAQLVGDVDRPLRKQLLLIVGGSRQRRTAAAYVYDRPESHQQIAVRDVELPAPVDRGNTIGLALSGGGFRAVAFHLGVLRALHDRGVLEKIEVISGVSGGSVLAAMWAYSDEPFGEFDERVVDLLQAGLAGDIARRALASRRTIQAIATTALAGGGKSAATVVEVGRQAAARLRRRPRELTVEPPFRRWVSRTTAFEDVLVRRLFGNATIDLPRRDVHVIINACELRSAQAFRFGSRESGSTRYGKLTNNAVPLARAVAASAAFPLLLPGIDTMAEFRDWQGHQRTERIILTDGGVYDNMGTSCLEPGRSPWFSTNVHPVEYIIACDAGQGVLDTDAWPLWWPSRVKRSFESVYRKVQDAGKRSLHEHVAAGNIKGFAMPFLGMNDRALPIRPSDLVTREQVVKYPTNFSPMSPEDLHLLTTRGEQLARLVIEHHCPDIA